MMVGDGVGSQEGGILDALSDSAASQLAWRSACCICESGSPIYLRVLYL